METVIIKAVDSQSTNLSKSYFIGIFFLRKPKFRRTAIQGAQLAVGEEGGGLACPILK